MVVDDKSVFQNKSYAMDVKKAIHEARNTKLSKQKCMQYMSWKTLSWPWLQT